MYNPLVSVIIPNYCHSKYLDQRIQSVLGQTYQNFEVIILDDCSPDNGASKAVIEKYRDNSHISHIIYNEQNSGSTFKQWNKGFNLAIGEYCWIAESDDFCDNDFLYNLVEQTQKYDNISIVACNSQFVDEKGRPLPPILPDNNMIKIFEGDNFIRCKMMLENGIYNASSAIFKREYALQIDSQYMSYVAAGDRLFWIELAEKGNVAFLSAPKNYFRQHQNKVSPKKQRNGTTSVEDYKIVRYLEKKGYVRFSEHFIVRDKYLTDIKNTEFDSENIRKKLVRLWTYNGVVPQKVMVYISNLYLKFKTILNHCCG